MIRAWFSHLSSLTDSCFIITNSWNALPIVNTFSAVVVHFHLTVNRLALA
jgi:hypothetical protein